jgi:hypothetical protein
MGAVQFNFWIAFAATTTLIFGAAYSLWMYKRVVFGAVANHHVAELKDVNRREFWMLAALAVAVLWMGLYPKPVTDTDASVARRCSSTCRSPRSSRRRDGQAQSARGAARDRAAGGCQRRAACRCDQRSRQPGSKASIAWR